MSALTGEVLPAAAAVTSEAMAAVRARRVTEAEAEQLRALAERLFELAQRPSAHDWWGVTMFKVRAYVWARFTGADPVRAIGRAIFGPGLGLYEADPYWRSEQHIWSRTYWCEQTVAHLDLQGVYVAPGLGAPQSVAA